MMNIPKIDPISVDSDSEELTASLSRIRNYVMQASALADLDKQAMQRLRLSVDEIATNIILYGYRKHGLTGVVNVSATIDEEMLTIRLEDTAVPYDPRTHNAPKDLDDPLDTREIGGLGIYLALNNVDVFDYERLGDRNINRCSMKRKTAQPPDTSNRRHLLLIHDSVHIHNELVRNLNEQEYAVTAAIDRQQALALLQAQKFDLILLETNLLQTSSYDLVTHIRSNPSLQRVPVVLISADSETEPIVHCIAAGADDYILYPFNPRLLQTRIKISIQRTSVQDQKVKSVLDISERIRRILAAPDTVQHDSQGITVSIDGYLQRALTEIKGLYNADAGTVYYREDKILRFVVVQTDSLGVSLGGTTGAPVTSQTLDLYDRKTQAPNYQNMATYVALKGETVNIPSIAASGRFDFTETKAFDKRNNYLSVSCLTVPLKNHRSEVIGVLQLLNAQDDHGHIIPFDGARQVMTEALCGHVATILSNRLLVQQQMMTAKIENDVRIGREIQQAFLPTTFPQVKGWEVTSYFRAAREVAGDFYDAFLMPNDRLGFLIADVCDKGVGAALFMSLMRSLLRAFAMQNYSIDWSHVLDTGQIAVRQLQNIAAREIMPSTGTLALENAVKLTNNYVATIHRELSMFATLFFGILDPTEGSLLYINGGHCPPMIIDASGKIKQRIDTTGPAVGMFPDAVFEIGAVTLEPGDSLFAFTDGVTDARNPAGKLFKEERLLALLQEPFSSMTEFLHRVEVSLENFMGDAPQFDDITMLGVRRER
jgi:sigma-B regulation protein RsbU (phosphoserine phosphatase)